MTKQRNTRQRQLVLEKVLSRVDHPTADEIYLEVRKIDDKISRGTVYRNLNLLAENGEIQQVKAPDALRFDWRKDKHYHIRCVKCTSVMDIPLPYNLMVDEKVGAATGFSQIGHRTLFEGICKNCQEK